MQAAERDVQDPWITRAAEGDREAVAQIVRSHGPAVWSLCRRMCPEPEDAYQEIWEKALGALGRFDPSGPASLKTWLMTIAHRHLIDRHRRRTVRGTVVQLDQLPPTTPDIEERLTLAQRLERLEDALQALPEHQRRVVLMHHVHGQRLDDIAREEGVATGTIKSRLHRARARLGGMLRRGE